MAEQKFTRCPGCKTIFRVTPQQLAMRAGQVRCGHCHTVFDGLAALVSLAPKAREEFPQDERSLGPPTVTLRSSQALQPAPSDDDEHAEADERDEIAAEDAEATAEAGAEASADARFFARAPEDPVGQVLGAEAGHGGWSRYPDGH